MKWNNWYKIAQVAQEENVLQIGSERNQELQNLKQNLEAEHPGLRLHLWMSHGSYIEVSTISLPKDMQNQGTGHKVMESIQAKAREFDVPVVLRPEPEPRKKKALMNFYQDLGFNQNKGKNQDYSISSPFGSTMVWRP